MSACWWALIKEAAVRCLPILRPPEGSPRIGESFNLGQPPRKDSSGRVDEFVDGVCWRGCVSLREPAGYPQGIDPHCAKCGCEVNLDERRCLLYWLRYYWRCPECKRSVKTRYTNDLIAAQDAAKVIAHRIQLRGNPSQGP